MGAAKYNKRITITAPGIKTSNGIGGYTTAPGVSSDHWCNALQMGQNESLSYGLTLNTTSYKFAFRYESAKVVTTGHTLTYSGKSFRIVQIKNIDEANNEIILIANERTN